MKLLTKVQGRLGAGCNINLTGFGEKLEKFFAEHNTVIGGVLEAPTVEIEVGPKYARVVRADTNSRSAYCFLNLMTGEILKPAGWKSPAKGIRGNVSQPDAELFGQGKVCGPYGVAYLR